MAKIFLNEYYDVLPKAKQGLYYIYFLVIEDNPFYNIIKIGTTNNMSRRMREHLKNYKKNISVIWFKEVTSKYTTLRVEDEMKEYWKKHFPHWQYLRNDRFIIPKQDTEMFVKIRKQYDFTLDCNCYEWNPKLDRERRKAKESNL